MLLNASCADPPELDRVVEAAKERPLLALLFGLRTELANVLLLLPMFFGVSGADIESAREGSDGYAAMEEGSTSHVDVVVGAENPNDGFEKADEEKKKHMEKEMKQ